MKIVDMNRTLLFLILILIIFNINGILIAPCHGQENETPQAYVNETYSNQIALNIYLDESGKALITGYIENSEILSELEFLKSMQYTFDNETHQLICITDKLTSKQVEIWMVNLSIPGYFTELSATIYLPKTATLIKIETSHNLGYYITSENGSLVIEVQGFSINDPLLAISYKLAISQLQPQNGIWEKYAIFIAITIVIFSAISLAAWKWRFTGEKEEPLEIADKTGEVGVILTPDMQKIIETLSESEKQIVDALIKNGGKLTQAKIRHETGIPKSSLTGIIYALERKKIVNKTKYGRTNVIELSSWFLGKNERK